MVSTVVLKMPGKLRSGVRSEEHTSELQSRRELVCRLLLEKKKFDDVSILACNAEVVRESNGDLIDYTSLKDVTVYLRAERVIGAALVACDTRLVVSFSLP